MDTLLNECCRALISIMNLDNVLRIRDVTMYLPVTCNKLLQQADKLFLENFGWISSMSEDFLFLEIDDLCSILRNDKLNAKTEAVVLCAICRYIFNQL